MHAFSKMMIYFGNQFMDTIEKSLFNRIILCAFTIRILKEIEIDFLGKLSNLLVQVKKFFLRVSN
jgi:hypothetical protein